MSIKKEISILSLIAKKLQAYFYEKTPDCKMFLFKKILFVDILKTVSVVNLIFKFLASSINVEIMNKIV